MHKWSATGYLTKENKAQPTNVSVAVHVACSDRHEFVGYFFSSFPLLALEPIGLGLRRMREWYPGWVDLPLRGRYNFARSGVYELHPAICWVLFHVFDELFFRESAHFRRIVSEESCMNVGVYKSSKLDFNKLFSRLA